MSQAVRQEPDTDSRLDNKRQLRQQEQGYCSSRTGEGLKVVLSGKN
jgi:hypothetical protein